MMRELRFYPPNFKAIVTRFGNAARGRGVLFSYGTVIYNPTADKISPALRAHEEAHGARQLDYGLEAWWARYLVDDAFRFDEEVIGHRAEWQAAQQLMGGRALETYLDKIAARLASPLYGRMCSKEAARAAITKGE